MKRFHQLNDAAVARGEVQYEKRSATRLEAEWLRELCSSAGADDVGFVDVDRSELASERDDILRFFPHTKSLISFVLGQPASMLILFAPGAPREPYFEALAETAASGRQLSDDEWLELGRRHDNFFV